MDSIRYFSLTVNDRIIVSTADPLEIASAAFAHISAMSTIPNEDSFIISTQDVTDKHIDEDEKNFKNIGKLKLV